MTWWPLLFCAMLWFSAGDGEENERVMRIADVRKAAQGNATPSRLGERVTTAGRASVGAGVLHKGRKDFFLQDGTGGLYVVALQGPALAVGDSVVVTGMLAQQNGLTQLAGATYRVVPGTANAPEAYSLEAPTPEKLEMREGQLVQAEGTLFGASDTPAGTSAIIRFDNGTLLTAFVFEDHQGRVDLRRFSAGDRVRITGILGQYDRVPPFTESYQIYPRAARDVATVGFSSAFYRRVFLISAVLLLLAGTWGIVLQRQVRRRTRQLSQSEARFRSVFEGATEAIFVVDEDVCIVEANPEAKALLGPQRQTQQRYCLTEAVDASERERLVEDVRSAFGGHREKVEVVLQTENGPIPVSASLSVIKIAEEPRVLVSCRDISVQKEAEAVLVAAKDEAESIARQKTRFLTSIGHEIRTPLTGILGFGSVLAEETEGELREMAGLIERSGYRLLETINGMLDLARLEADAVVIKPEPVDVVHEVKEAVALLRPIAEAKNLALEAEYDQPTIAAHLDVSVLHRILNNIVGNAIKFTEKGGVTVNVYSQHDRVRLDVRDTGVGIEPSFLPHVFDEFKREASGVARNQDSTGLGLAITKSLVEKMQGEISLQSEKGKGTTFTVVLPRDLSTLGNCSSSDTPRDEANAG